MFQTNLLGYSMYDPGTIDLFDSQVMFAAWIHALTAVCVFRMERASRVHAVADTKELSVKAVSKCILNVLLFWTKVKQQI